MKLFKKVISLVVTLAMLCSMAICVSAATPTFAASTVEAKAGETAEVVISMANNPGIISMAMTIDFDSSVMDLTAIQDTGVFAGQTHKPELTDPYYASWSNDSASANITSSGDILKLTFTVKEDAADGEYPITISYIEDEVYDFDIEPVEFAVSNGAVKVVSDGATGGEVEVPELPEFTNPTFAAKSVAANAGETVEVGIVMANNPGIISMAMTIDFDSSVMDLTAIQDTAVFAGQTHKPELTDPYYASWSNDSASANITSSGEILKLTFAIKAGAAAGEYPITISYIEDEVYDFDIEPVAFDTHAGVVIIGGGDTPDPGPIYTETKFNTVDGALVLEAAEAVAGKVLVASYSNDGKTLVDVDFIDVDAAADTATPITYDVEAGTSYKAMFWADLTNCAPIIDALAW